VLGARRCWIALVAVVAVFLALGSSARAVGPSTPDGVAGTYGQGLALPSLDGATGAFNHTIAFELPAARGDAQPSLALTYRSGRGTGEAGEGWGLDIPPIERSPLSGWPRYADDSKPDAEDRYSYGGQA
jgi:hypothetical protein